MNGIKKLDKVRSVVLMKDHDSSKCWLCQNGYPLEGIEEETKETTLPLARINKTSRWRKFKAWWRTTEFITWDPF